MSRRYLLPEFIRLIAISQVIAAHVSLQAGVVFTGIFSPIPFFYSDWGNGVALFVIISGLSLTLSRHQPARLIPFLKRRLVHIYPTYWLSLPLGIVVFYGFHQLNPSLQFLSRSSTLTQFTCSFTATCPLFSLWGGPVLPTGWFILLIVSLYLLYPWLYRLASNHAITTLIVSACIARYSYSWISAHANWLPLWSNRWLPFPHLFEFVLGIVLGLKLSRRFLALNHIPGMIKPIATHLSQLTFPLFLIHYPLLSIIVPLISLNIPTFLVLSVYLAACLGISEIIYRLASKSELFIHNHPSIFKSFSV